MRVQVWFSQLRIPVYRMGGLHDDHECRIQEWSLQLAYYFPFVHAILFLASCCSLIIVPHLETADSHPVNTMITTCPDGCVETVSRVEFSALLVWRWFPLLGWMKGRAYLNVLSCTGDDISGSGSGDSCLDEVCVKRLSKSPSTRQPETHPMPKQSGQGIGGHSSNLLLPSSFVLLLSLAAVATQYLWR